MEKMSTKAREFDFSLLNELILWVSISNQLTVAALISINLKFLTDASLQKNECRETSIVKWQSYTPSNGQQEGQAQSIQLTQLCQAEHLVN